MSRNKPVRQEKGEKKRGKSTQNSENTVKKQG